MTPSARDPARACAPRVPSGLYYIRKYSTLPFESAAMGAAMRKERTARPSRDLNDGENGLKRVPVLAAPVPDENGDSHRLSVDWGLYPIATPGLRNSDAGSCAPARRSVRVERPPLEAHENHTAVTATLSRRMTEW